MTTETIVTLDLGKFGARERAIAVDILTLWEKQGLPEDFSPNGVTLCLNQDSGYVFLSNEDFQVCMPSNGSLESFYSCPQCGHEGFKYEMKHGAENEGCQEFLKDIGVTK